MMGRGGRRTPGALSPQERAAPQASSAHTGATCAPPSGDGEMYGGPGVEAVRAPSTRAP